MLRTAVIDLGSNTSTLAVFDFTTEGGLDRVEQVGEPLKLLRRLGPDRRFPEAAIRSTVDTLRGFAERAAALGARAEVVATSAVRDAVNQDELVARVRQVVPIRVLDGETEGVCAAVAVTNTLPVTDGFVVDQGGGSLQVVHLTTRRARQVVSLPLGALRLADQHLGPEPLNPSAISTLRRHIQAQLGSIGWFRADAGGELVAVGGALRALARLDRRRTGWPLRAGHGYRLTLDAVESLWEQLSRMNPDERRELPGLPGHRVETIVAAAFTWFLLLRATGFEALRVCSYGLREGVAYRRLYGEDAQALVPDVRLAGLSARVPGPTATLLPRVRALTEQRGEERWLRPLIIAAWVRAAGWKDPEKLLESPLCGFWQEDTLGAVELLTDVSSRFIPEVARRRLRDLVEAAIAG